MRPPVTVLRASLLLAVVSGLLAGCTGTVGDAPGSGCGTCSAGTRCITNADFPTGLCTRSCEGSPCASGSECVQLTVGEYCLARCGAGGACPTGSVCGIAGAAGSVCLAPAAVAAVAGACPAAPVVVAGGTVGPASAPSGCQAPTVPSTWDGGTVVALGSHAVGEVLRLQLPPGTSGFSIVSQGNASGRTQVAFASGPEPNAPVPTSIIAPGDVTFFDYPVFEVLDPSSRNLVWSGPLSPLTAALTFPNTSAGLAQARAGLPAGAWTFRVDDLLRQCGGFADCTDPMKGATSDTYDVTVLLRSGGIPARGTLDLGIYLVSTDATLTSARAPTDPQLQRAVRRIAADLARAGICLGTVTYYDVPAWARQAYHVIDGSEASRRNPCSSSRQLFTLAAPGNAAALFFVDEITDPDAIPGSVTVGIDGAIPGVSTVSGTVAGGALVSAADLRSTGGCGGDFSPTCGADLTAETAAHELGHFLGLFHPSEPDGASGDSFDGLVDTPACLCSLCVDAAQRAQCADQPGATASPSVVDGDVCVRGTQACGGGDYLMFWQFSSVSAGRVSPQQGEVMRMNPLVRPL